MKLAEYLADLDPNLADNLERALDAVRGEFEEKITRTVQETVSAATEAASHDTAERESTAQTPTTAVSGDEANELRLAALQIDSASSQSEILEALAHGVRRFSSRVAIFVNRSQDMHGWNASGFGRADGQIKEVSLARNSVIPSGHDLGEGAVALSDGQCAPICDALSAEHPSMGLLLPFVLGNQVVGTVYCDRLRNETFSVPALQLLTYIAGQTLETLPVRKRESTSTLVLAAGSQSSSPEVETPQPETEPEPEPQTVEQATGQSYEPEPEPEPVVDDLGLSPGTAEDREFDTPDPAPVEPLPEDLGALDETVEVKSDPDLSSTAPIDDETTRPGTLVPEPSLEPAQSEPLSESPADVGAAPDAENRNEEPAASPVAEPAVGMSSTQVAPPSDLQGPGWAFTGGNQASDSSSESPDDEAERLARLLVTEIKLYNEEKVAEGRRKGNVYSGLKEDIDRSRQIFEDRIDPGVRDETDYFKQALVRILAGGDAAVLGL